MTVSAGNSMMDYADFAPVVTVAPGWSIRMARGDFTVIKVWPEWRDTGPVIVLDVRELNSLGAIKRFAIPESRRVRVLR